MPDAIAFPVRDILARARLYLPDMSAFLRDLIRIPSPSCHEEAVVRRIIAEMEKLGYTAEIDGMGNALGWLGSGSRLFAYDAHIDTVGPGTLANWSFDPYAGFEDEYCIGGLGASDQSGGMASMLYGGKIMADLGLRPESVSILMAGTVQEEDCDGLCWQYLIRDFLAARGMRDTGAVWKSEWKSEVARATVPPRNAEKTPFSPWAAFCPNWNSLPGSWATIPFSAKAVSRSRKSFFHPLHAVPWPTAVLSPLTAVSLPEKTRNSR